MRKCLKSCPTTIIITTHTLHMLLCNGSVFNILNYNLNNILLVQLHASINIYLVNIKNKNIYFHQGGYVIVVVCMFVSNFAQKLPNGFA